MQLDGRRDGSTLELRMRRAFRALFSKLHSGKFHGQAIQCRCEFANRPADKDGSDSD
jgi:hypothetical protein